MYYLRVTYVIMLILLVYLVMLICHYFPKIIQVLHVLVVLPHRGEDREG